ncbi:MAG: hypothetical protein R3213_09565 [Flavobacteriaceae bacterium]|nr:hypothetical protein [Flavobacteriaceae bacterium]
MFKANKGNEMNEKGKYIRIIAKRASSKGTIDRYISIKPGDKLCSCEYCGYYTKSDKDLPFFREGEITDKYYCGCFGWD